MAIYSNVTFIIFDEKICSNDAAGMQTSLNSFFWNFFDEIKTYEADMDFYPTNNAYAAIFDEPIEQKMSFVTEEDFSMKFITLAHHFQSPIGEPTSL